MSLDSVSKSDAPSGPKPAASGLVANYLGLVRFSHTIFAMPFAILAAFLAYSTPLGDGFATWRFADLAGILLCMVFARSAAMAFNRLVDHRIDAENPRTKNRHLPAGLLSRKSVLAFTVICSVGFVASTLCFLPNWLPLALSVPVLGFLCGYSLAKRFTASAHLWLGVALSLSPICVWVAIRGGELATIWDTVHVPLLLAGSIAFWVAGFDILYACQDAEYDRSVGLHSIPAKYGIAGGLRIAAGFHLIMLVFLGFLAWTGAVSGLGGIFAAGVVLTAILVIYQHWLVSPADLSRVNEAFFQTNAIVSVLLLIAGVVDCWA